MRKTIIVTSLHHGVSVCLALSCPRSAKRHHSTARFVASSLRHHQCLACLCFSDCLSLRVGHVSLLPRDLARMGLPGPGCAGCLSLYQGQLCGASVCTTCTTLVMLCPSVTPCSSHALLFSSPRFLPSRSQRSTSCRRKLRLSAPLHVYLSGKTDRGAYSACSSAAYTVKASAISACPPNSEEQRTFTGWRGREDCMQLWAHDFNSLKNVITHKPKNQIKFECTIKFVSINTSKQDLTWIYLDKVTSGPHSG
jgi:hypothetical protein